jgi:molecular chaperone DnaK
VVEILPTNGDVYLGGSDIDKLVADYVVAEFRKGCSVDISKDPQAMTRILEAVEKAKIELSNSPSTEINIPYITATQEGPKHLLKTLTRANFERICDDIFKRAIAPAEDALKKAKIIIGF